ncbi:nitrous oxide reductase family maturation protein NosD [Candidatus Bipolaricaulota bacterium]
MRLSIRARRRCIGSGVVLLALIALPFGSSILCLNSGVAQETAVTPPLAEVAPTSGALQKLIDECEEGETITLPAGEFRGPLLIAKSLSIIGAGTDQTSITAPRTAPAVVTVAGEGPIVVVIENVQIRGTEDDETGDDSTGRDVCHGLIATGQGHLALHAVLIQGTSGHGVFLDGGWNGRVENSTVQGNREGGIVLERSTSATIIGNLISGNGEDGIRIEHTGSALIEGNRILGNDEHGVLVGDLARAVVEFNLIRDNHEDGIHISGAARVELLSNEIVDNSRYGVFSQSAENLETCGGNLVEDNNKADYSPGAAAGCP